MDLRKKITMKYLLSLDKMDKIGKDGVAEELCEMGYDRSAVDQYLGLFDEITPDVSGIRYLKENLVIA